VDGKILPPAADPSVSTDNRIVVFYKTAPADGYALDTSGSTGLSGRAGEFMLNALEDWRLEISPGTYSIAIVKGADGYGKNPTELIITGQGFDTSLDLALVLGEGIDQPSGRALPPWLASDLPYYQKIWFNDKIYQKNLVAQDPTTYQVIVPEQPKITATVSAPNQGIDTSTLAIVADSGTANEQRFPITSSHITRTVMGPTLPVELDLTYDCKTEGKSLTDGAHILKFYAGNSIGTTYETATVKVATGPVELVGTPLNFPSPLHLTTTGQVFFQYGLSRDANIDIYVFDISGTVVKKFSFTAGSPGGMAGGSANPNKIAWDLSLDQGGKIGSGIYLWNIVDRSRSKILGKGKLAAAP